MTRLLRYNPYCYHKEKINILKLQLPKYGVYPTSEMLQISNTYHVIEFNGIKCSIKNSKTYVHLHCQINSKILQTFVKAY
jgi:hypothetical protein